MGAYTFSVQKSPGQKGVLDRGLPERDEGTIRSHLDKEPAEQTVPIAISIISNSRLLREGLLVLLSPHLNLHLLGTYPGELHPSSPLPNPVGHVVLLDGGVGREAVIAWTRYWQGVTPPAYVLVLELPNNIDMILTCIEVGASGYTLLGDSAAEIAHAIGQVHQGVGYSSPEITAQLFSRVAALRLRIPLSIKSPLTRRELEVLRAIAQGYNNREIATILVIELRTVKQHIHNILGKLNLHSRGEAVRFAFEQGWLNTPPISPDKPE